MSLFSPFRILEDLKRYDERMLSKDAEKSLRNFTILIIICVIIDSAYLAYIAYVASGIQLGKLAEIQLPIAAFTLIAFLYLFVSVDKSIVASDLFSEEKIRRVKYKDIDFISSKLLNKCFNFLFYSVYLLTSPIKAVLSAHPAAAFILTIRVVFMVTVHVCVLVFVFLFTSDQVGNGVAEENKVLVGKIYSKLDELNEKTINVDQTISRLKDERKRFDGYRTGEAEGSFRPKSAGPGDKYKYYDAQIKDTDAKIDSRVAVLRREFVKKIPIDAIDFHHPERNKPLLALAAMTGVELREDGIAARASHVFANITKNPADFIGKMVPTLGMSLLLIAPLFILILMKVFQNRSLRHYYDIELQEHYEYYQSGIYNWLLSDKVKRPSGQTTINAIVFSDIYYEIIRKFTKNVSRARLSLP